MVKTMMTIIINDNTPDEVIIIIIVYVIVQSSSSSLIFICMQIYISILISMYRNICLSIDPSMYLSNIYLSIVIPGNNKGKLSILGSNKSCVDNK